MDPLYGVFAEHARKYGLDHAMDSFQSLPADQVASFRDQFEGDLARVEEGGPPIITAGRDDWYSGPSIHDVFWPALEKRFEAEEWPRPRINDVHAASNTVVGHTPRPSRSGWDAKGLVVGYVQSGKTTNFISVMAKMADVEYRMIIVLSGIHNGLRRQTQERIDESLSDLHPDKFFKLTDDKRDFLTPTQTAAAVLSSNKVAVAVAKKNQAVLLKIIDWLDKPAGRRALQSAAVLIIDDEADQASVATKTINPLIRRILSLMPKSTYIGYTATPFANVFIDPADNDLYPKSFILNLPRPKGYFGPEKIFGRDGVEGEDSDGEDGPADGYDMVRHVPEKDVTLLRPGSREPADEFMPKMTKELKDAVHWFWLATAVRRARADFGHSTMLIHTSVKTRWCMSLFARRWNPSGAPLSADLRREITTRSRVGVTCGNVSRAKSQPPTLALPNSRSMRLCHFSPTSYGTRRWFSTTIVARIAWTIRVLLSWLSRSVATRCPGV